MYAPKNLYTVLEDAASSCASLLVYPPGDAQTPRHLAYNELLVSAKHKARLLHSFAAAKGKPVILLHFDNHLDTIQWFWATVVAGFLPAISTPLVNDLGQRKKHLLHLSSTLRDPLILTASHLKPQFLDLEQLRVHAVEDSQRVQWRMIGSMMIYLCGIYGSYIHRSTKD